jgi:hypothetical protein
MTSLLNAEREKTCSPRCKLLSAIKKETSGCWIWQKPNSKRIISWKGKTFSIHRLGYEMAYHTLEKGKWVQQTCGNLLCIAPNHLITVNISSWHRKKNDRQNITLNDNPQQDKDHISFIRKIINFIKGKKNASSAI